MRKLVVFLIVFAIGLALVLWLRGSEPEKALPQSPAGDAEKPTEFTEFPVKGDKPDEPSRPVGVSLDGRLDLVQRSGDGTTLKPLYELHADDVDLVGGDVYELKVLTIDVRNLDTGELRAQMSAAKGRMKLVVVDGTPAIGPEEHATFDDVELTLHEGVPIVPLTLEMPHLDWELSTNRFRSDDRVKLRGQGLTAEGVGLDADPTVERVHLAKEGVLRLDVENGAQMTLSATGAGQIMVEREMIDGEPAVHLRAFDGSRLVQTGERAVSVDAQRLNLHGREGREAHGFELVAADASGDVAISSQGSVFRAARADFRFDGNGKLQTAHLEGDVVLEGVNDIFRADQADFHFDASGALRRADLVGSPSGTIQVGRFLTPEVAGAHDVPTTTKAEISGVGPLVVEFGPRTTLDLKGPGELRVPAFDFALQAQRSLQAELDQDRQRGELVADGAVTARYQGSDLASEKLTLNYSAGVPGQELVDAVTEGPTTLRGAVPGDARLIVLEAQQGLSVQSKGDGLTVPIARAARITVADPDGVEARAALVRDFDWRARTFVAEGDVSYAGPNGQGRASRVVSHGPDDLELFGESGALARYEFREVGETTIEALTEAIEIHARKDVLDATGEARATVAAQDRKYELQGAKLHLDLAPAVPGEELRPFHAEAEDGVRTTILFVAGNGHLSCDKLFVDGVLKRTRDPAEKLPVTKSDLRAVGNVRLEYHTLGDAIGECDLFTLDREGRGRMSADPGRRIRAEGRLPTGIAPYEMTAEWLEFDPKHLEAAAVDVKLKIDGLTPEARRALNATAPLLELSTDRFVADSTQVLMRGKAHAKGRSAQDEDWWIDAGSLRLEGQWLDGRASKQDALDGAHAWDGFEAGFGARAHAFGERLDGSPERLRIEGTPARLSMDTMEWESSWIQYERANMLLSTDRGYLHPREEASKSDWSVTYESMQPFDHDESTTILVLRNPLFRQGEDEMRADWALFWVDRGEWMKSGKTAIKEETGEPDLRVRVPEPPPPPPAKRGPPGPLDLARLSGSRIGKVLNEVYVEGNIEFLRNNARTARAKSIYLDIVEGHGWIQDADVLTDVKLRGRKQRLRAKADWMRVSNDSSMRADNAVITSCDYDAPHYVIKTGRLEVKRTEEGGFSVSATQNELAFGDTVAIPMPPLVYAADENFVPLIDNIAAGNFAKFGTSVTASFNFTLGTVGKGIGGLFGKVLGFPETDLEGHWKFRPGYLGSRGVILGTGLEFEVPDRFTMDIAIDGIPDSHEDKGLVRVPTDDRSTLRTWFRTRGRYNESPEEWFDLALSKQSDPGVQSEFFEKDYLEYEQKDNYVHWRKANDQYYFNASAKVLLEDRTDIEELPSVGTYRGLTPIGTIADQPVLYRAYGDVAYLKRRNGDPDYYAPFPDGLGDRDVLRGDTEHRLEMPIPLGFGALIATPFVYGRATAWNEGVDPNETPTRLGLFAGVDLATTLWKRYGRSTVHAISPFISVHGDIVVDESGGEPVPFDQVEEPIEGQFIDVGLRTRLWKPRTQQHLDLEVRTSHAEDNPDLEPGFQPVAVLGEFFTFAKGVPVAMTHDGRYDVQDGDTDYSRTYIGFEPHPKLGIEFGYNRGLDENEIRLYEAASVGARYRATPKWEFEATETVSIADNEGLHHGFLVRRLGHDFILEIESGYRAGEGASFGISVTPDLSYRRSSLGLIDRWLGVYR